MEEKDANFTVFNTDEYNSRNFDRNCGNGVANLVPSFTGGRRTPPITANATITIAQVGGGVGTVLSSLKELRHHWRQAFQVALLNTLGGVLGAIILVHSSNAGFQKVVPIFILLAGVLILVPKSKREITKNHWFNVLGWLGVFLVGIYSGYFGGAAAGLLMIAVLSKIINEEYAIYNAMRNFATFCNNVVAASIFAWRLTIDWQVIVPLLVGLFVGGVFRSHNCALRSFPLY